MRARIVVAAVLPLGLIACEKPVQKPQQADAVARKWIAAAVINDGQTYCALMTPRHLQAVTHQPAAMATKACEMQIKAGTGNYPFQYAIPKPTVSGANAQVDASGKTLRGHIILKQQKGKLLIDAVR